MKRYKFYIFILLVFFNNLIAFCSKSDSLIFINQYDSISNISEFDTLEYSYEELLETGKRRFIEILKFNQENERKNKAHNNLYVINLNPNGSSFLPLEANNFVGKKIENSTPYEIPASILALNDELKDIN